MVRLMRGRWLFPAAAALTLALAPHGAAAQDCSIPTAERNQTITQASLIDGKFPPISGKVVVTGVVADDDLNVPPGSHVVVTGSFFKKVTTPQGASGAIICVTGNSSIEGMEVKEAASNTKGILEGSQAGFVKYEGPSLPWPPGGQVTVRSGAVVGDAVDVKNAATVLVDGASATLVKVLDSGDVTITNSTVGDIAIGGFGANSNDSATVSNNTVTQGGIEIVGVATVRAFNNTATGGDIALYEWLSCEASGNSVTFGTGQNLGCVGTDPGSVECPEPGDPTFPSSNLQNGRYYVCTAQAEVLGVPNGFTSEAAARDFAEGSSSIAQGEVYLTAQWDALQEEFLELNLYVKGGGSIPGDPGEPECPQPGDPTFPSSNLQNGRYYVCTEQVQVLGTPNGFATEAAARDFAEASSSIAPGEAYLTALWDALEQELIEVFLYVKGEGSPPPPPPPPPGDVRCPDPAVASNSYLGHDLKPGEWYWCDGSGKVYGANGAIVPGGKKDDGFKQRSQAIAAGDAALPAGQRYAIGLWQKVKNTFQWADQEGFTAN